MRKTALCFIAALLLVPVYSQDAGLLTAILEKKAANYADFSYMLVSEIGMECSPFEAYTYCDRFDSFNFTTAVNTPITVKSVSFFLMNNYGLTGGIMWSVFKSPRYAYKQLKNDGFWKPGTDPDSILSGRDLVRAVSRFFNAYPASRLRNPSTQEASAERRKALIAEKETTK